jgi:hypothetical protein
MRQRQSVDAFCNLVRSGQELGSLFFVLVVPMMMMMMTLTK